MTTARLPFMLMRSGTSKGVFLRRQDLLQCAKEKLQIGSDRPNSHPEGKELLQEEVEVILDVMGSGSTSQLCGLGGGTGTTSKCCVVGERITGGSRQQQECDYWFVQCSTTERKADFSHGDCGNMIAGVGTFALEENICAFNENNKTTTVTVHSQSTGNTFEIDVPIKIDREENITRVEYDGNAKTPGVQGSEGAPILVNSLQPCGAMTGRLWPQASSSSSSSKSNGKSMTFENGVQVTCLDASRCLCIVDSKTVGLTCSETREELETNKDLMQKLEQLRLQAGVELGLGDCTGKVSPKLLLCNDNLDTRYFVAPFLNEAHPTIAMTAAQGLAIATIFRGTVPNKYSKSIDLPTKTISDDVLQYRVPVRHPGGVLEVTVDVSGNDGIPLEDGSNIVRTGYERTVTRICKGVAFI